MGKAIHYHSLAWDVLKVIGYGAIIASLFVAPNIGVALASFLRNDPHARREWRRREVQQALKRLRERRLVRYEQRGNDMFIVITEYGKRRLRQFEFDNLAMAEKPRHWDRRWRIIVFDIPEKKQRERKIFRDKLHDLGFLALQKSVFVYPYPCEDEIDFISRFLDIERHLHYIEAVSLGTAEGKVRQHFALL